MDSVVCGSTLVAVHPSHHVTCPLLAAAQLLFPFRPPDLQINTTWWLARSLPDGMCHYIYSQQWTLTWNESARRGGWESACGSGRGCSWSQSGSGIASRSGGAGIPSGTESACESGSEKTCKYNIYYISFQLLSNKFIIKKRLFILTYHTFYRNPTFLNTGELPN